MKTQQTWFASDRWHYSDLDEKSVEFMTPDGVARTGILMALENLAGLIAVRIDHETWPDPARMGLTPFHLNAPTLARLVPHPNPAIADFMLR